MKGTWSVPDILGMFMLNGWSRALPNGESPFTQRPADQRVAPLHKVSGELLEIN